MATPAFDWLNGDMERLRAEYERQRAKPIPEDARWLTLGTARVLEHKVSQAIEGAIVYFHGGGFIVGSPLTHVDITTELCRRTGLRLCSVDYRLAPEFVAPAPIEDGCAVVDHLLANGTKPIILCGDSAGGAIALAVEACLPPGLRRHITCVCSFYGAYGLLDTGSLIEKGSRADGTDAACLRRYFALATATSAENPYAIGALAKPSPVPAYLMAAADDPLRDDTIRLAQAFDEVARDVTVYVARGESHGLLHNVEFSQEAANALEHVARWIKGRCRNQSSQLLA
jgi:monoterpene epsilon-lactone hydrolase